jgi:hypothetical protein
MAWGAASKGAVCSVWRSPSKVHLRHVDCLLRAAEAEEQLVRRGKATMKLYTFPAAPNGRKVNAVIHHLEIKGIETEVVNLMEGAQKKPEYLAINPLGRIPTLVAWKQTAPQLRV